MVNLKVSALPNSSLPNVSWFQLLIVAGKNENLYGFKCVGRCLYFLNPFFTLVQPSPSLKTPSVSTKLRGPVAVVLPISIYIWYSEAKGNIKVCIRSDSKDWDFFYSYLFGCPLITCMFSRLCLISISNDIFHGFVTLSNPEWNI